MKKIGQKLQNLEDLLATHPIAYQAWKTILKTKFAQHFQRQIVCRNFMIESIFKLGQCSLLFMSDLRSVFGTEKAMRKLFGGTSWICMRILRVWSGFLRFIWLFRTLEGPWIQGQKSVEFVIKIFITYVTYVT